LLSFKTTKENKVEKKKTETAKTSNPAPTAKARVKKIAEKVAIEDKKLKTAPKTKLSKSNLKLIEGIGPKLESILNEAGILTFDQLAKAKPAKIKTILETAGPRYKMHDPTSWSKQAKLAAANKMEELKALQAELKGGKATK
jgi:predicted flap endonuclease-1-like 5' DNA nuclease